MKAEQPSGDSSDNAQVEPKPPPPSPFSPHGRKRKWLVAGPLLLVAVGVALYGIQQFVLPTVDNEKTKPIVMSQTDRALADPNTAATDRPTAERDAGLAKPTLPPGAITAKISQESIETADHPFDPLLAIARESLQEIDAKIADYTCTLVSQVAIDGELQPEKYSLLKVRHAAKTADGEVPFSVYMNFLKPKSVVGQEVIWVQGQNDGNLIAHLSGLMNVKRAYLSPDHPLAMKGNRYPIRQIGFRNLLERMIEIGEQDRQRGECFVTLKRDVEINGVSCTVLQVEHPEARDYFEYHRASIYIDDERNIPVAYEGYLWPSEPGGEPPLLERYFYIDIETNIGLTDADFDPSNEAYNYPGW